MVPWGTMGYPHFTKPIAISAASTPSVSAFPWGQLEVRFLASFPSALPSEPNVAMGVFSASHRSVLVDGNPMEAQPLWVIHGYPDPQRTSTMDNHVEHHGTGGEG